MVLEDSYFRIYSASAGSGKTYALTKEYLKLLLSSSSPLKFRQILAITFTNKAVNEMKGRILENLYAFGKDQTPKKQLSLFQELCQELSLDPTELRKKSNAILKRILHNYSFFEISTIDKFNHKIIKTFARDLQISQNFEVELDTELLLEEAVGRLLERAGSDKELTEVLIAFSLEKIDDDKSWNIAFDLVEIGKLLFQENHTGHIEPLRTKSIKDLTQIKQNIALKILSKEKTIVASAENVLLELEKSGFEFSDFPRQTLPNHFKKIAGGEFNPKNLYNNKLEQNLVEGKILKANDSRDVSKLSTALLEAFLRIKKHIYARSYLKNIYGNIVPLTVLAEIAKEIKNIEIDRDIVPISSLNTILSKEIKDQPVPFIYERMGEKYRHYFIDEFQDTSQTQWENLIPLIGNALESESQNNERGSLFLVGDVKQAIYRWRGGRAEQFLDLINKKELPFVVPPNIHSLDTNWRSHDQIVTFNNSFFANVAPVLQNEDYQQLFLKDSYQKTNKRPGGYVQLTFLDSDILDKEEVHCGHVLDTIQSLISKKFKYSDICVLVRDNNKGMALAHFLAKNNIPIISSDALLLQNNQKVAFLIALLKVVENAKDKQAAYEVLLFLSGEENKKHEFISQHLDSIQEFLHRAYGFNLMNLKGQPVSSILEAAIILFELAQDAPAHLTFLMDEVLNVEKSEGPSIHSFLKYWEIKKTSLSVASPDNLNAVKIMTIHKAKGLEFPFVIFPFANSLLDDKRKKKKSWVPAPQSEESFGLDQFLVNTNKEMLEYSESTSILYKDEEEKSVLDALNVLYVALTRAVLGLYVITERGKELAAVAQASSYSDLFQFYAQSQNLAQNEIGAYSIGSIPELEDSEDEMPIAKNPISYITRPKQDHGFNISTSSIRLWDDERRAAIDMGNLVHFALSKIKTAKDIQEVMSNLLVSGHAQKEVLDKIQQKILDVVNHPDLIKYFGEDLEIMNEQEILTANGLALRPDRIMISGNEASVIDYKTGSPSPSHKAQILHYAEILKQMNFKIKDSIIVYIDQKINPVFV
ncbi:UvrD-helicase domain-containing protein [Flagellimonas nanhaiensis]|uniref:DNA 3'-5' helicase n=1 Tax=Flagellimonas nanhaiensis TaxID=2292706 RepID=A0A371JQB1_9FLAO|nr:UvrD-helicase domain-containing protein [Allomuricauda nanhaiensis]RDY59698.1 ATP-dependent helicase [Allomuricauda nanhaiensis]